MQTNTTLSPAQKAAQTRRARRAAVATPTGFSDIAAALPAIDAIPDADLLAMFSAVGQAVAQRFIKNRPALSSFQLVIDYLKSAMAFQPVEQFRILFLDKRNNVIADEVQSVGTIDHCPVYVREVAKRALELGATALILTHNHPSGDPSPSRADVQMTQRIIDALKPLGIRIHDHVIIGRDGHSSLKALQLI